MKKLEEKNYYVYAHRRNDSGEIFYIGKGKGGRATSKSGRNKWWVNIVAKHGYSVEYLHAELTNDEACSIEIEVISKLRSEGVRLCNIFNGGESGNVGIKLSEEHKNLLRLAKIGRKQSAEHARKSAVAKKGKKQPRDAVEALISKKRKPVINSEGDVFISASHAARAMAERFKSKPSQGNISMVCRGERPLAYGLSWSYDTQSKPKKLNERSNIKKRIRCENGMVFDSVTEAAEWVRGWRGGSNIQPISSCARGETLTSYGYKWEYIGEV